jgi:hypothetical protein
MSGQAYITVNFAETFPYYFWISTWQKDEFYPDGFRYKMLSSWRPASNEFEAVLLCEARNGDKSEMKSYAGPVGDAALSQLRRLLSGMEETFGIEFEEQDLSAIRDPAAFEAAVCSLGWNDYEP